MFQAKSAHRKAIDQQDRSSRAHDEAMSDNMGSLEEDFDALNWES